MVLKEAHGRRQPECEGFFQQKKDLYSGSTIFLQLLLHPLLFKEETDEAEVLKGKTLVFTP